MNNSKNSAERLIEAIKNGSFVKEILINSAANFSGKKENESLERYRKYLKTMTYEYNLDFKKERYQDEL